MLLHRLVPLLAVASCAPAPVPAEPPPPPSADERRVAAGTAAFGLDLHRALARLSPDDDSFVAPYSLVPVLALLAEAAEGETAGELDEVLHMPADAEPGTENGLRPRADAVHAGLAAFARRVEYVDEREAADVWRQIHDAEKALARLREIRDRDAGDVDLGDSFERETRLCARLEGLVRKLPGHTLRSERSLWLDHAGAIDPDFARIAEGHFGGNGIRRVDFGGAPDEARDRIAAWFEEVSGRGSGGLVGEVSPDTLLIVLDTLDFAAGWSEEFRRRNTKSAPFARLDGTDGTVDMMEGRLDESVRYAAFDGAGAVFDVPDSYARGEDEPSGSPGAGGVHLVEMPYRGLDVSFLLAVPVDMGGLPALEARLTHAMLEDWLEALEQGAVDVRMPRFEIENTLELEVALEALGIRRAFERPDLPGGANFTRGFPDHPEGVFVDALTQRASIRVDEKGTVVEVDTRVSFITLGIEVPERIPFVPEVVADRPFLFMVLDRATGTPLFVGRKVTAD